MYGTLHLSSFWNWGGEDRYDGSAARVPLHENQTGVNQLRH
jgi:hypothetical protein